MLETSYNNFFNKVEPINENLDKTRKMFKEQISLTSAVTDLNLIDSDIEYKIKNGDIGRMFKLSDFPHDMKDVIQKKMREVKVDRSMIKSKYEDTEEFKAIRSMVEEENNIGMIYIWSYFYYMEDLSMDNLKELYNDYLEVRDIVKTNFVSMDEVNRKKFDNNFINESFPNEKEHRTNNEILHDGIEKLKSYRVVKKVIDTLPKKMRDIYKRAPLSIKDRLMGVAILFDEIKPEDKKERVWKNFFGSMRLDTNRTNTDGSPNPYYNKKRFQSRLSSFLNNPKPLETLINHAEKYLKNNLNDRYQELLERIADVNDKMGDMGANIITDENNIVVINVLSWRANNIINAGVGHCIVNHEYHWNNYTSDHRLQYYVYNFNLPASEQLSVIGVTVRRNGTFSDIQTMRNNPVGDYHTIFNKWEKEYKLTDNIINSLKPISSELVEVIIRRENVNKKIATTPHLTVEELEEMINDGVDVNHMSGIALYNAVSDENIPLIKHLLENGADPNIYEDKLLINEAVTNTEIVRLLIEYGAEMVYNGRSLLYENSIGGYDFDESTGEISDYKAPNIEEIKYYLDNGLDPNFGNGSFASLCYRKCRISSRKYPDVIEDYSNVIELLLEYGFDFTKSRYVIVKNMISRGGGKLLPILYKRGVLTDIDDTTWTQMKKWLNASKYDYVDEQDKDDVMTYIEEYSK